MDERTELEHRRMVELLDRVSRDVYSTNVAAPGLAVRLDRVERQIATALRVVNWIGTGGIIGLMATVYLLYRVLQAMEKTGGL